MATIALPLGHARVRPAAPIHAWLLSWVVVPNLLYVLLWLVGAPSRAAEIIVIGSIGMVARYWPYRYRLAALWTLMLASAALYLAALFNLWVEALRLWAPQLPALHPEGSFTYVAAGMGLIASLSAAAWALRHDGRFEDNRSGLIAVGAVLLLTTADHVVSEHSGAFYGRMPDPSITFTSGVRRSGFDQIGARRRHRILVMVESLGVPVDPAVMPAILRGLDRPEIRARYSVRRGTTPYYGATINGEMRALCGQWMGFADLSDHADRDCLPAQLARRGYATTAIHAFQSTMFNRATIYPHMGFDRTLFGDQLIRLGATPCGGVFQGACDRDIPALIGRKLRRAQTPQFIYWLTLNTHLPVPPDASLGTEHCPADAPASVRDLPMVCRQFVLWRQVIDRLADQLADPATPPAIILIVGDHMPPYFSWHERAQFDPGEVPWIELRAR